MLSQAREGWEASPVHYDDGGYSGGNVDRPGLQKLLADIEAGLIDVVVVYKIDRLTRSLADFARIVEVFEKAEVSFVSVTQSFNTTGSMGKLMLNVLLSFAQFEREVNGERIRDKIAASKAKGLWMGGNLPLGYDLPKSGSRVLQMNDAEAACVRHIFARYLELGSVHALQRELTERGVLSKRWTTSKDKTVGGQPFSRGALFHLLRNPVYLGKIRHKKEVHEGEHPAILDQGLFDAVQAQLDGNARRHRAKTNKSTLQAPLTGKLFDAAGEPMSPTTSRGKTGRKYRYYVSASLQQGSTSRSDHIQRLSAHSIEQLASERLAKWLGHKPDNFAHLTRLSLRGDGLVFELANVRPASLAPQLGNEERILHETKDTATIFVPLMLPLRGSKTLRTLGARKAAPDHTLIAALRKAHAMLGSERGQPVLQASPVSPYDRMILRLAFLAPDIQRDILAGRQPPRFNLEAFRHKTVPLSWSRQRKLLGWEEQDSPCYAD